MTAPFGPSTLPYGVADGRVVTRLGDGVVPVGDVIADNAFEHPSLNRFMAEGPEAWAEARRALTAFVARADGARFTPVDDVELGLPFEVGDYVDFYSSLHHASNLGRLFRPEGEPLLPNWRRLPVGYHGRSGTVVTSGTTVVRPIGLVQTEGGVERRPASALDIELEVGFVVGVGSERGQSIAVDDADAHVFGAVLLNDWSARDIQAFEYQPLGPFLGKSFLTSISAWVVPLDALRPFLIPAPTQEPAPDTALSGERQWAIDLQLAVELNGTVISRTSFADLYWTFAQQLAHLTSNGATTRTGDLFASGTVSGPEPGTFGSLIELTWRGRDPIVLRDGSRRTFLEDGDTVVLRGWCGEGTAQVDFGEVAGTVVPAGSSMFYRQLGDVPGKRHTVHRDADGRRLREELVGEEGFSGDSSLLYHRESPSALLSVAVVDENRPALDPLHPVAPLHMRPRDLAADDDPVLDRHVLVGNDDVRVCVVAARTTSVLHRNAVGDELAYVQRGTAALESSFGTLAIGPGDYVLIPAGVTHRWLVTESPLELLVFETSGHVSPPHRYLSPRGQFLEHAPYCERDVRIPDGPLLPDDDGPADVFVRTAAGLSRHTYAHHPFDVVGWDGCLYPWALSIHDFEPVVGSLHQPPPVHQTFEGPGFVVCSFVPRPFDFHPDAVKVPYHHANVDSDEVLFYSAGDFMSRAGTGIGVGSLTMHPAGFVHGPQPGSFERSANAVATEELAVMLDTFRPLRVAQDLGQILDPHYLTSWAE